MTGIVHHFPATAFAIYRLSESPHGRRDVISYFSTFEAAKDVALSLNPIDFEEDADHPGCADFITKDGTIYAIEPCQVAIGEGVARD